jgi:uncharacterized protein (DUF1330 family)
MKAYLIVDALIRDREKFAAYAKANAALVAKLGGRYLVLGGGEVTALEGGHFKGRAVVSEWPSRAAALAYWNSAEYAEVRKLREGICEARVTLVDGLPEHAQ